MYVSLHFGVRKRWLPGTAIKAKKCSNITCDSSLKHHPWVTAQIPSPKHHLRMIAQTPQLSHSSNPKHHPNITCESSLKHHPWVTAQIPKVTQSSPANDRSNTTIESQLKSQTSPSHHLGIIAPTPQLSHSSNPKHHPNITWESSLRHHPWFTAQIPKVTQTSPANHRSDITWLRTSGVYANGAAAKLNNLTDWGKRYALALLGEYQSRSRECPKSPSVKNMKFAVTPLVLAPSVPFGVSATTTLPRDSKSCFNTCLKQTWTY